MNVNENIITLYGLKDYLKVIDKIIVELKAYDNAFDIKLILTEALTNAFKYENDSDSSKPIYLKYHSDGKTVRFKIKVEGKAFQNLDLNNVTDNPELLEEHGKGLFLIKHFSDNVKIDGNAFIIEKKININ